MALFHTRQTNSSALVQPLPPPPPPPPYNVEHVYTLFLQSLNIVFGGGGEEATHFKTDNSAFLNSVLRTPKINAITQRSQGILSTIVGLLEFYWYTNANAVI